MNDFKTELSIVSPVYMAEKIVDKLVAEITKHASTITDNFEIILVEDGSRDDSWKQIEAVAAHNSKVKAIKLSRNFGQHYAINSGISNATGRWVVVMDCDLQDRPENIPTLYQEAQKGYDIVLAQRIQRTDGWFKRTSSKVFYKLFGYFTDTEQDSTIANFGIYHNKVIQAVLSMNDSIKYFPTMIQWVGFNKTKLEVDHGEREEGSSSYSWRKLFKLAFDNILSFSNKPLKLTVKLGFFIALSSAAVGIYYLILYLNGQIVVLGFASLIISLWFLAGIIMLVLGIVGLYIGKVFDKVKDRPVYIVDQKINFDNE